MRQGKGLNENLGREILELHTLGVDGGYTQDDVEALARILTGWSVARLKDDAPGSFKFYERAHEPGAKTLLGRRYAENGQGEGVEALRDLAQHPATARHIATKLARHFIADQPPPDAVARIARSFIDSGGDLARVTAAVVAEDAVWQTPFAKLRTPTELLIAACRVAGFTPQPPMLVGDAPHARPAAVLRAAAVRLARRCGVVGRARGGAAPRAMVRGLRRPHPRSARSRRPSPRRASGRRCRRETREAIARAPSRRAGFALALASPEFQRR